MAKGGSQISALHLAIAASGGVLLYAALQGKSPAEALKAIASGTTPPKVEKRESTGWTKSPVGSNGSGSTSQVGLSGSGSALVTAAEKYLGVPYVWGGVSPSGMDCSGLTVLAFKAAYKVTPPRTTYGQEVWSKLARVTREDLSPGDLVFWPGHVAIYAGGGRVIHAPRPGKSVKYEGLNTAGPVGVAPSSYQRYKASSGTVSI